MAKRLDKSVANDVALIIQDALDDAGYVVAEEVIPGLVEAIVIYAGTDDQLLDEASDLLADGGDATKY